jgi:hypothetical protein
VELIPYRISDSNFCIEDLTGVDPAAFGTTCPA